MILSTQQILNRNNDLLKEKNSTSLKIDGVNVISNEFNRSGLLPGLILPRNQMPRLKVDGLKLISNNPRARAAFI